MSESSELRLLIERRRPSGGPHAIQQLQRLDEKQAELWSDRIDEWHGRVAKVLEQR